MGGKLKMNRAGWNKLVKEIVETEGVERMGRVAAAANAAADLDDGYRVSVEGPGEQLSKHSYHATVITATAAAMVDNARNNTLVNNFHHAGGE